MMPIGACERQISPCRWLATTTKGVFLMKPAPRDGSIQRYVQLTGAPQGPIGHHPPSGEQPLGHVAASDHPWCRRRGHRTLGASVGFGVG
jgi:hypothetical protein